MMSYELFIYSVYNNLQDIIISRVLCKKNWLFGEDIRIGSSRPFLANLQPPSKNGISLWFFRTDTSSKSDSTSKNISPMTVPTMALPSSQTRRRNRHLYWSASTRSKCTSRQKCWRYWSANRNSLLGLIWRLSIERSIWLRKINRFRYVIILSGYELGCLNKIARYMYRSSTLFSIRIKLRSIYLMRIAMTRLITHCLLPTSISGQSTTTC